MYFCTDFILSDKGGGAKKMTAGNTKFMCIGNGINNYDKLLEVKGSAILDDLIPM